MANDKINAQLKKFDNGKSEKDTKYAEKIPNMNVKNITKNKIVIELKIYSNKNVSFNNLK